MWALCFKKKKKKIGPWTSPYRVTNGNISFKVRRDWNQECCPSNIIICANTNNIPSIKINAVFGDVELTANKQSMSHRNA